MVKDQEKYLLPWFDTIKAFREHPDLRSPVFVQIGQSYGEGNDIKMPYPSGFEMNGSVLPRMILALTSRGSIVGLFGQVTQT